MGIEILDHGVVASRPGQMYGWPGATIAANGDILVSASERRFHVGPYGCEVLMRSKDGGENWSLPYEIYNNELDDRDANITTLKNGDLIFSWFTSDVFATNENCRKKWPERAARVTDAMRKELLGTWMMRSKDNGDTWEKPLRMPVGMHISPVELSDESLLSVGWVDRFFLKGDWKISCHKSADGGQTWRKTVDVDCPSVEGRPVLNENHVIETAPGKLTALFRKCGDYLWQAFSEDFGETWTTPVQIGIWGFPPHMLKLSDGRILCVVGHRRDPYSIRGVVSEDNGATWNVDDTFTIHEWPDCPDMGYPVSVQLPSGEILTVFYCQRGREHPHYLSTSEGILFTKYRIDREIKRRTV